MLRSTVLTIACLFAVPVLADSPAVTAPAQPTDMVRIFDGTSLDGWDGDTTLWSVKDGVIHGETTPENPAKGNTFIIWKEPVKDFEFRASFRCTADNNSGIQYRSQRVSSGKQASNKWVLKGYQHEIRNEENFPNVPSFIYDEKGTRGRICLVGEKAVWTAEGKKVLGEPLITAAEFKELMKVDEWNDVVIIAKGNHIQHYLNGRLVLDFTDEHPEKSLSEGVLGLQLHAGKPMWAEFKDIRLKHIH
ncbi:3-keto-disaccharide hydrolase [Stieleria varia]|uniref:3-keto-alpha-glucoside-1,2-lyase/3-keto-2-hydroxy-glucal hydratase domain-containing protein n=1 Tax=Stieleria varia TaxID=2528005 RepID=A0A5C6B2B1_9BACT|nr:DUF1080 domain-containing protein [Stieleria varia]TWU05599.1 hypothetical protein Pla52n_13140 [Stieleria varia]